MSLSLTVIAPGPDWDAVTARLAAAGLTDVYFDHRYVTLYLRDNGVAEAMVAEGDGGLFFFPYIRRPIPGTDLWDFETAYGYGGPLATRDDDAFLAAAWDAVVQAATQRGLIAGLVRFHPLLDTHRFCAVGPVTVRDDRDCVVLPLDRSPEQVWAGYASDNRRKIRKAEQAGVVVTPYQGPQALARFGDLYHGRMADLAAESDYFFGDAYFQAIAALGEDHYRVFLAEQGGEVIGGCLVLIWDGLWHYHLSGSRRDRFALGPNNALRHAVIQAALGQGRLLHFGGGRTADPADPLLAFKARFSPDRVRFRIGTCVLDRASYDGLCARWAEANPDKVGRYGRYVLRYRY